MSGPSAPSTAAGKCPPVCQLFVNGQGKRSRYTLTNFASMFAPQEARPMTYAVKLLDETGAEVASQDVTIAPFGTADFFPNERFSETLPELGLLTAELRDYDGPAFEHLGLLRPYFYAIYHDDGMRSVAVVHPQTTFLDAAPAGASWRSSHIVACGDVQALEVFQINPTNETRETAVAVCDLGGEVKASSAAAMGPRSVRASTKLSSSMVPEPMEPDT